MSFDAAEREILLTLQGDGRISNVDLAERVGLSESPCFRRVKKLEDGGVIRGYRADLNRQELGLQVTAFVLVSLDQQDDTKQRAFLDCVDREAHIVECHAMSGSYDYLLKVLAYSMEHFSELAMSGILKYPAVKSIESNFSLQAVKESAILPVR
jgi:Lrp/AsnC family leucine-responsive transcriptional regulator